MLEKGDFHMKFLKVLAVVFIPALLAFGVYTLFNSGVLERWQPLTAPTDQELEYLAAVTAGGPEFSLELDPEDYGRSELKSCDLSTIEFSFVSNHPASRLECAQLFYYHIDGYERNTYTKDAQGALWLWRFGYTAIGDMGKVFWPLIGLIVGAITAIVLRKKI